MSSFPLYPHGRARGWDFDPVGVARVPLRQVIDDVSIGSALGNNLSWHHADVFGADGRRIGRVRCGIMGGSESVVIS